MSQNTPSATATKSANKGSKKVADAAAEGTTAPAGTEAVAEKPKSVAVMIGPKRKLAFALVGVLALLATKMTPEEQEASGEVTAAKQALVDTGYAELKPQTQAIADLQTQLNEAVGKGDSAAILELGKKLKAVQEGRF